jgi:hypothetical protein
MSGFRVIPWTRVFARGNESVSVGRRHVFDWTLPQHAVFLTFRVVIEAFTLGSAAVSLQFGFTDTDIDGNAATRQRIVFATLSGLGESDTRSLAARDILGPSSDFVGTYNAVAAPRVAVFLLVNALNGFRGVWSLHYSGMMAP